MSRRLLSFLSAFFYLVVAIVLVVFAVSNRTAVEIDFYPFPYIVEAPFFLLGIILFALGLVAGGIHGSIASFRKRRELRHERKRIATLENEIALLKARPASPIAATSLTPPQD